MNEIPPKRLGLAGDGDEVDAIERVEHVFGVRFDADDASAWSTAGDVYASLQRALPAGELQDPDLWAKFAAVLALETGVDADGICRDTPLIEPPALSKAQATSRIGLAALLLFALFLLGSS